MISPIIRFPLWSALTLALGLAVGAQAQDDRWFKVELLVFSHETGTPGTDEAWDPDPLLAYPGEFRFLVDHDLVEANLAAHDATSSVDEFGRQLLVITPPPPVDEFGNPLLPEEDEGNTEPAVESAGNPDGPSVNESSNPAESSIEVDSAPLPVTPTPFVALPGSAKEFRGKAAYMRRTGRYQILFHENWVQPVASEDRALPLVLDRSGDSLDWPRLQGSVKIYLSRYLHIQTDLWLNTMGHYLPAHWEMPPAPLGPQSLIIEYPEPPEILPDAQILAVSSELPELEEIALGPDATEELLEEDTGPVYPWRHAVTLKQKRRMRSTEVHYIDHPMLGVVVLISPITDEELEAMAVAELASELSVEAQPE